jgi:hypothetical protein
MKTIKNPWQSSIAAISMFAALNGTAIAADRSPAGKTVGASSVVDEEIGERPPGENAPGARSQEEAFRGRYGAPPTALPGMDPRMAARYGLDLQGVSYAAAKSADAPGSAVQAKLEQIQLKQTEPLDGLPLGEVINFLDEQARKADPEKEGVNFILSNAPQPQPQAGIDPRTGLPLPAVPAEVAPVEGITIKLPKLRNVRLKDLLDAITRVADRPVRYTVEDYGVVFSADFSDPASYALPSGGRSGDPGPLQVRTFAVNTNTLLAGLESAFGIKAGPDSTGTFDAEKQRIRLRVSERELREAEQRHQVGAITTDELEKARAARDLAATTNEIERARIELAVADRELKRVEKAVETGATSTLELERARGARDLLALDVKMLEAGRPPSGRKPTFTSSSSVQAAFRKLFAELGINMDVPGKSLFYNPLTGMLMVRASGDDLTIVQAAIETLSGPVAAASTEKPRRIVSVLGQVGQPGVVELPAEQNLTVLEAIAMRGGFTRLAKKTGIEVTRQGVGGSYKFTEAELKTNSGSADGFFLRPGDVVRVDESLF